MNKLFNDSDSDQEVTIKTDNSYAQNYDTWRGKEELNKFKLKYGRDVSLTELQGDLSGSSSEEEDDDAVELTEEVEKDFYKTLSCLKNKDPRIYDENVNFFNDKKETANKQKKQKEKPFTVKDAERKLILENGGIHSEEETDDMDNRPQSPTYVEEQRQIRENLVKIVQDDDEENDNDWGGLFKKREKTKQEKEKDEEVYKQWLAGQEENLKDKDQEVDLKGLKDYWSDPKLEESEKFLKDYILNKRYLDNEDPNYIPTYEEIVHDSDKDLSEDEKNIEDQEEFEHKYNFRFEEPDQEFLKRYPRTMEHSVRKKDDKRKQKRAEIKQRKLEEKKMKEEELKHLKALKRKEIEAKLQQLRDITGNDTVGFQDEDVDGEFDAEAHDERMRKLFNDEFYGVEEDDQKPTFNDDEELDIEGWDNWRKEDYVNEEYEENYEEPHCEDDNFNMDCDYDPTKKKVNIQSELIEQSKGKKKRRRRNKFTEVLLKEKPVFDPTNNKSYEEYLDEYYKLDYEDIIGDLPCRFKYRKTEPNSFGLSIEEILYAKDKELNSWCSLKKAVQIRPETVERYDLKAYEKKAHNEFLKRRTFKSLYYDNDEEENKGDEEIKSTEEKQVVQEPQKKLSKNQIKKLKKRKLAEEAAKQQSVEPPAKKQKLEKESIDKDNDKNKDIPIVDNEGVKKKDKKKELSVDPDNNETKLNAINNIEKEENTEVVENSTAKKKKNKNDKIEANISQQGDIKDKGKQNVNTKSRNKNINKKNKKKIPINTSDKSINLSEGRLRAYGFNPKKFKNKQKYLS